MPRPKKISLLEKASLRITDWMGTPHAIAAHTLVFILSFLLIILGVSANSVMLVVTTAVSLETIYLALFIQMTVNRQSHSLSEVEKDIDEIQEDVEDIEEAHDEIDPDLTHQSLHSIEHQLTVLSENLLHLKQEIDVLKNRLPSPPIG